MKVPKRVLNVIGKSKKFPKVFRSLLYITLLELLKYACLIIICFLNCSVLAMDRIYKSLHSPSTDNFNVSLYCSQTENIYIFTAENCIKIIFWQSLTWNKSVKKAIGKISFLSRNNQMTFCTAFKIDYSCRHSNTCFQSKEMIQYRTLWTVLILFI